MKKILFIAVTLIITIFNIGFTYSEDLNLNAQSYVLIDADTGQVLYEKNADEVLYPASTTKIMAAALALEKGDMDQMMEASQAAVYDIGKDGMNIGIMPGETIRMEDLLNALLVRSANETANIIAENICSTRQEFIDLMNEKAKELGALNTHFVNPCGAHDDGHYTTARDMAVITRYAMTLPQFKEIVRKTEYEMPATNKHTKDQWGTLLYTTNHLLRSNPNELFDITGVKTGYTNPAGHCLVSSAVNGDGVELIAVVMGVKNTGSNNSVFEFSEQLLEYGFKNYAIHDLLIPGQVIKAGIPVMEAAKPAESDEDVTINLITETGLKSLLPVDKNNWNIQKEEHIASLIKAPVIKGENFGYIEYKKDGIVLGKVNVVANKTVEQIIKPQPKDNTGNLFNNPTFIKVVVIAGIVLLSFVFLRIILKSISRRVNAKKYRRYKN